MFGFNGTSVPLTEEISISVFLKRFVIVVHEKKYLLLVILTRARAHIDSSLSDKDVCGTVVLNQFRSIFSLYVVGENLSQL